MAYLHNYYCYCYYYYYYASPAKVRLAEKLQLKADIILPLVGLARSKQDPIYCGHGAQYLYRPCQPGQFLDLSVHNMKKLWKDYV